MKVNRRHEEDEGVLRLVILAAFSANWVRKRVFYGYSNF